MLELEQVGRVARFSGRLSFKLLEASLSGLIRGTINCFEAERLSLFIEKDWSILEAVFYGLHRPPVEAYREMTPKEAMKAERFRLRLAKTVLPVLGMARIVASRLPAEAVESKVTADWLLEKGGERFPKLASIINQHGERGRAWLEKQAKQIREYLTGRIIYDPKLLSFVSVGEVRMIAREA